MKEIFVIPARGGSKGIPRKNVRHLAGKPLIAYVIEAVKKYSAEATLYVSTDDEEIATISERFGASVVMREPDSFLAGDVATLDDVIEDAINRIEALEGVEFDVVITIQPTSPLLTSETIQSALNEFLKSSVSDTLISVVEDTHLRWERDSNGIPIPLYSKRVNRQELPKEYRETGGLIICNRSNLHSKRRIGKCVSIFNINPHEAIDIDSILDFSVCEYLLTRKSLVFVVKGYSEIGLGHAYRCLTIANCLTLFNISFVCEEESAEAYELIKKHNYDCHLCGKGSLFTQIKKLKPDLIVNDTLDTSEFYMSQLNTLGAKIISFEDLGHGARHADLVINDLYPSSQAEVNTLSGPKYFCLRDEFTSLAPKKMSASIQEVLLCFGGTDPANLTTRVLNLLTQSKYFPDLNITVVTGPGYENTQNLEAGFSIYDNVRIVPRTKRISDYMYLADLAFTSNGRTVFELSSVNTLSISISQNERETTHLYASNQNGIYNLGLHSTVSDHEIMESFELFYRSEITRRKYHERLKRFDVAGGTQRVVGIINDLIKGKYEHE